MSKIIVISSSVRIGRNSHRLALFFKKFIEQHTKYEAEILDLNTYQFPIFEERLQYMKDASAEVLEVAQKIKDASGVLIVTPEYNGGYPASLKNLIDLLYAEWRRKPIAIAAASDGGFGGTQVVTSLIFSFWKIGALLVPAKYQSPKVQEAYDANGIPTDPTKAEKLAKGFIDELVWCIEAKGKMEN